MRETKEPIAVTLVDIRNNKIVLLDRAHGDKCDVNPVDLTWRRRDLPGVKMWVCRTCYDMILRKYEK